MERNYESQYRDFIEHALPLEFFQRDTIEVAKDLLGKVFVVKGVDGEYAAGMITEVEAYLGVEDKGCHAFGGHRSQRNEAMYRKGGHLYVYLCYGLHHLLNFVTKGENEPEAVLLRAIQPIAGVDVMMKRRKMKKVTPELTAGPARTTQALGITTEYHNGKLLQPPELFVSTYEALSVSPSDIVTTPRIGIAYAGKDALLPLRFYIKDNAYVSKPLFPQYAIRSETEVSS